jgi:hypothetical protein
MLFAFPPWVFWEGFLSCACEARLLVVFTVVVPGLDVEQYGTMRTSQFSVLF